VGKLHFNDLNKLSIQVIFVQKFNVYQRTANIERREKMKRIAKTIICIALISLVVAPFAIAESEVDPWKGTWTVKMKDRSTVTWELTDSWVSQTGKSCVIWGIQNPGNVEFLIVYLKMFSTYNYIEAPYGTTSYDLPQDFSQFTELVPSEDFQTFTAKEGKYPIKSGYRGTVPPGPCAASYLLGADDPRLDVLRQFRDEKLASSIAGEKMIKLYYQKSADIIAICEKNPAAKQALKQMLESAIPALEARGKKRQ
jgi:hypothetical protein